MRRFIRRLRSRKEDQSIHTISGKRFWPLDARAEDVDIYDIAYSLSQKCRYNGHCRGLYTVAQHCVLASQNTHHPQWALMHDAAEAYLPDVSRPLKPELKGFTEIEDRLLRVIAPVFGLEMPFPKEVHRIDAQMLVTEWRDLMPKGTSPGKNTSTSNRSRFVFVSGIRKKQKKRSFCGSLSCFIPGNIRMSKYIDPWQP